VNRARPPASAVRGVSASVFPQPARSRLDGETGEMHSKLRHPSLSVVLQAKASSSPKCPSALKPKLSWSGALP